MSRFSRGRTRLNFVRFGAYAQKEHSCISSAWWPVWRTLRSWKSE